MKLVKIKRGGIVKILPPSKIQKFLNMGYMVVEPKETEVEEVSKEEEKQEEPEVNLKDLTEEELRALAKEKGIKSWHNKKIENLIKELGA